MSLAHWPTSAEVRDLKRLLAKKLGIPRFRQKLLQEDHSVCGDDESQVVPGSLQLLGSMNKDWRPQMLFHYWNKKLSFQVKQTQT